MITRSISEGFRFAFSVKRVIPYIILNLIIFYVLIGFFSSVITAMRGSMSIFRVLLSFGLLIPAFIVIGLVSLWINGAMIDQAKYFPRKRSLVKSFEYSASRYLSMLGAAIIYGILVTIISSPKYIGFLFSLALNLVFFYLYPAIIVDKKRCIDSFKKSFNTFMKYPLETFVTWILTSIISIIIVGLFALPLLFLFVGSIADLFVEPTMNVTLKEGIFMRSVLEGIKSAILSPLFIPYLFVFTVALAFNSVFTLGVRTRLYINTKKIEV
jgi:hypothetical protein